MNPRPLALLAPLIAAAMFFPACAGTLRYTVAGTSRAVGADAEIIANVNPDQSMTRFEVRTLHLPPPNRVSAGADTYVVWARRDNSQPFMRVGSLKYDPASREGDMKEASVPEAAFQLVITAESGPFPPSPSENVVFEQVVER